MGLLDKLQKENSKLSKYNGNTPTINQLATKQSKLHADDTNAGYSLDGAFLGEVNKDFQSYDDGINNSLPVPTYLDNKKPISKYSDNPPEIGSHF